MKIAPSFPADLQLCLQVSSEGWNSVSAMGLLGGGNSLLLLTSFQLSPVMSFFLLVQSKRLQEHLASPGNALHDVILSSDSATWMEILLDSLGCGVFPNHAIRPGCLLPGAIPVKGSQRVLEFIPLLRPQLPRHMAHCISAPKIINSLSCGKSEPPKEFGVSKVLQYWEVSKGPYKERTYCTNEF